MTQVLKSSTETNVGRPMPFFPQFPAILDGHVLPTVQVCLSERSSQYFQGALKSDSGVCSYRSGYETTSESKGYFLKDTKKHNGGLG